MPNRAGGWAPESEWENDNTIPGYMRKVGRSLAQLCAVDLDEEAENAG